MKQLFFTLIIFLVILSSCSKKSSSGILLNKSDSSILTYEVYKIGTGWGYKIYKNGIIYINQDIIPSVCGNFQFDSYQKAQTTATFVLKYMSHNVGLPEITVMQLDSLGVLNQTVIDKQPKN